MQRAGIFGSSGSHQTSRRIPPYSLGQLEATPGSPPFVKRAGLRSWAALARSVVLAILVWQCPKLRPVEAKSGATELGTGKPGAANAGIAMAIATTRATVRTNKKRFTTSYLLALTVAGCATGSARLLRPCVGSGLRSLYPFPFRRQAY